MDSAVEAWNTMGSGLRVSSLPLGLLLSMLANSKLINGSLVVPFIVSD